MKDLVQTADWKREKHVPVIEVPDRIKKGELFPVKVTIGKEIAHPNKTEHHIAWIDVFFLPNGEKFAYQIGKVEFCSHGHPLRGRTQAPFILITKSILSFKTDKSGRSSP